MRMYSLKERIFWQCYKKIENIYWLFLTMRMYMNPLGVSMKIVSLVMPIQLVMLESKLFCLTCGGYLAPYITPNL
ncbi:hypothetical protein HanPI659440_Chr03g0102291 [Helianthus annuus]|nr:hypothetical protein HanPI659440_Chr03g0102291 [Helianthus annuus]